MKISFLIFCILCSTILAKINPPINYAQEFSILRWFSFLNYYYKVTIHWIIYITNLLKNYFLILSCLMILIPWLYYYYYYYYFFSQKRFFISFKNFILFYFFFLKKKKKASPWNQRKRSLWSLHSLLLKKRKKIIRWWNLFKLFLFFIFIYLFFYSKNRFIKTFCWYLQ